MNFQAVKISHNAENSELMVKAKKYAFTLPKRGIKFLLIVIETSFLLI